MSAMRWVSILLPGAVVALMYGEPLDGWLEWVVAIVSCGLLVDGVRLVFWEWVIRWCFGIRPLFGTTRSSAWSLYAAYMNLSLALGYIAPEMEPASLARVLPGFFLVAAIFQFGVYRGVVTAKQQGAAVDD